MDDSFFIASLTFQAAADEVIADPVLQGSIACRQSNDGITS